MATVREIQKQIEQLTTAIQQAEAEYNNLKQKFASGQFAGKGYISDAVSELEKLKQSMKSLTSQRAALISERDSAGVEKINKSVDTLSRKLIDLHSQKQQIVNTTNDQASLDALDKKIRNTYNALKSFQSQQVKMNIPGGAGAGGEGGPTPYINPLAQPNANIARIALADVKAGRVQTNQMDADVSNKVWNQYLREVEAARMRIKFEGDVHYQAAKKWAEANGFAVEDLKKIQGFAGGKQQVATFERVNPATGVTEQGRVGINQQGQVTQSYIPRQNQTFGQGIFRDFAELTKWSIAISLLYAPLNALNDALTKMIANQAKLAQVSIAVNESIANQSQIFDTSARTAQQMGEDVGGVIDAFDQAYRAAGSAATGAERYNVATKLLTDSITLEKISTLDHAQAIDYLSAALLQTNRPLDEGAHLLDEWVLVSRNANVTVGDLAQAVATIGGSAETAGLSIEQLNSVVAALSQSTPLTGASLTNAVKALIGQYQTPEAVKALQTYGIAVKDVSGKTREFLDVMGDIDKLRKGGILDQPSFNALTLALGGGGIRNQKNVQQFLENFSRINDLTRLQEAGAGGQAAQALATKLDTVQTAATRLGNAFQELGQSLGTKGGLLDDLTILINFATTLVDLLTKLSNVLGKTGPLLAGVGIAALIGKNSGAMGGMIGSMFPFLTLGGGKTGGVGTQAAAQTNMLFSPAMINAERGALLKSIGLSALAVGIPTAGNIAQKDYAAAGADIAGGLAGALVGGPIGALVGTAIAEAFVNGVVKSKDTLADALKPAIDKASRETTTGEGAPAPNVDLLWQEFAKTLNLPGVQGAHPYLQGLSGSMWANIATTLTPNLAAQSTGLGKGFQYQNASSFALAYLKQNNPQAYAQFEPYLGTQTQAQQLQQTPAVVNLLKELRTARTTQLQQQIAGGEIKPTEYANQIQALSGYIETATTYMAAFGDEFKKLRPEIKSDSDEYKKFLDIVAYGTDEQKTTINAMIAGLQGLTGAELQTQKNALAQYVNQAYNQIQVQQFPLPGIVGGVQQGQGRTQAEVSLITQTAKQMQELFYTSQGASQDIITGIEAALPKFSVYVEDAGKAWYATVEKTDQKFYQDAEKQLEKLGQIAQPQEGFGIQAFQTTRPVLESLAAKSIALGQQWANQFPGFETKPEEVLAQTTDGITKPITADLKILALLLQDLNDKAQKQLDGMYNIPEGATFWVPITAAYYRPKTETGGLDVSALNAALTPNTDETYKNTLALQELTKKIYSGTSIYGGEGSKYGPSFLLKNLEPAEYKQAFSGIVEEAKKTVSTVLTPEDIQGKVFAERRTEATRPLTPQEEQNRVFAERRALQEQTDLQNRVFAQMRGATTPSDYLKGTQQQGNYAVGAMDLLKNTVINPVTKLDLRVENTTTLMLDGRVIYQAIKPYLAQDLVSSQQTQSSITRQYVI